MISARNQELNCITVRVQCSATGIAASRMLSLRLLNVDGAYLHQ
jgi:hypothetical protein